MPDPTPFHVGMTPERVVATAAELTRESHLSSWSIRDLAARLGVAPSVIYHHVGGKDLLSRRIVERLLADIRPPQPELPWQQWFATLLHAAGPALAAYPGTAKWMLLHGPTLPAILPLLESGLAVLDRAGFGERTGYAYAVLLNNAMLTVSLSDDRVQHEDDGPRDHAAMMAEFRRLPTASPRVEALGRDLLQPLADGGAAADQVRWDYYRFVIDTTIAGLEATLR